jgi:RNA polymerase-binding transcription factor DksA
MATAKQKKSTAEEVAPERRRRRRRCIREAHVIASCCEEARRPKKAGTRTATHPRDLRTPIRSRRADREGRMPERATPEPWGGVSKDGITYTKDFDVKFLKAQRDLLLEAERARLLGQADAARGRSPSLIEEAEMGDVQFDDEGGEGDTMVVERERDLALSAQARQTIADIDAALARIEAGTYGYSAMSGRPSRASGSKPSRGPPSSSRRRSAGSAGDDRTRPGIVEPLRGSLIAC